MRTRIWILAIGVLLGLAARGVKSTYDAFGAGEPAKLATDAAKEKLGENTPSSPP